MKALSSNYSTPKKSKKKIRNFYVPDIVPKLLGINH
jgi:hypothetical protein